MEEEPTGWCSGVDSIRQALELDAQLVQCTDQIDQLFDATAQPIQFPDDECVPSADELERRPETLALSGRM